jgi:hypothetical protein
VDVEELLRGWYERRREILKTLPPDLLAEYRQIGRLIKGVLKEQVNQIGPEGGLLLGKLEPKTICKECHAELKEDGIMEQLQHIKPFRVSLVRRKETLLKFLAERGPSTRGEILRETDIPPGSLSMLLQHPEFENAGHGLWRLGKVKKK